MIAGAVDLHKKYGQYFVDVEGTKPVETRLDNDPSQIKRFFDAFEKQELKIAVESTRNWYWLVDLLQEMGIETVLSNPEQTKAIAHARVKTDKVTAETNHPPSSSRSTANMLDTGKSTEESSRASEVPHETGSTAHPGKEHSKVYPC